MDPRFKSRQTRCLAAISATLLVAFCAAFGILLGKAQLGLQGDVDLVDLVAIFHELTSTGWLMLTGIGAVLITLALDWRHFAQAHQHWQTSTQKLSSAANRLAIDPISKWPTVPVFEDNLQARLATLDHTQGHGVLIVIWLGDLADRVLIDGHWAFERLINLLVARLSARLGQLDLAGACQGRELRLLVLEDNRLHSIMEALSHPIQFDGKSYQILSEIGYAQFPDDARASQSLLDHAWCHLLERRKLGVQLIEPMIKPTSRSHSARASDPISQPQSVVTADQRPQAPGLLPQ